jgi:hypothetical protein
MENPVVHDAQSATDRNTGFSFSILDFSFVISSEVSVPRAVATGSGDNSIKTLQIENCKFQIDARFLRSQFVIFILQFSIFNSDARRPTLFGSFLIRSLPLSALTPMPTLVSSH